MKRIILFMIVLSLSAFNAHGADLKIGYVDINRALNECDEGKEAIKALRSMVEVKETLIAKKSDEIRKLEEEIAKQRSILTQNALREKEYKYKKLKRDYNRMKEDLEFEYQQKQTKFMQKIILGMRKLIKKIGAEENYAAIFEASEGAILYIPEGSDLTDRVIKRYNEITKSKTKK